MVYNDEKTWFDAWGDMLKQGLVLSGCATRAEYWHVVVINVGIGLLAPIVMGILFGISETLGSLFGAVYYLGTFVVIIPGFTLTVRRLHDVGKSAWTLLWSFVPFVGFIVVLYFLVQPHNSNTDYIRSSLLKDFKPIKL